MDDEIDSFDEFEEEVTLIEGSFQPLSFDISTRRIRDLYSDYCSGDLDPRPPFQRGYVWDRKKASRLVESVLLNVPLPLIYTAEDENGNEVVIDGQQRLLTFFSFITGIFPRDNKSFNLSGLGVLSDLNGQNWSNLDSDTRRAFEKYGAQVIKIRRGSSPDVKFEIFERLNSGSVGLNSQELRNCVYRGTFNELLRELAQYDSFLKLMEGNKGLDRMMGEELVLRFCAFFERTAKRYDKQMKRFLNDFMMEFQNPNEITLDRWRLAFKKAADLCLTVFGRNAYRRYSSAGQDRFDGHWQQVINRTVFEIQMTSFAFCEKRQVTEAADRIREAFIDLSVNDAYFDECLTKAVGDRAKVNYRFEKWDSTLSSCISVNSGENRLFSSKIKRDLFERDPVCAICGQVIQMLDDAHLDHIQPFSSGGSTSPENMQLTHRYCNKAKGGGGACSLIAAVTVPRAS